MPIIHVSGTEELKFEGYKYPTRRLMGSRVSPATNSECNCARHMLKSNCWFGSRDVYHVARWAISTVVCSSSPSCCCGANITRPDGWYFRREMDVEPKSLHSFKK